EDMWLLREFLARAERHAPIDTRLRIDPKRWTITRVTINGIADVTDGKLTGVTALHDAIVSDINYWQCERCKEWGPFALDEQRCLNCGHSLFDELVGSLEGS